MAAPSFLKRLSASPWEAGDTKRCRGEPLPAAPARLGAGASPTGAAPLLPGITRFHGISNTAGEQLLPDIPPLHLDSQAGWDAAAAAAAAADRSQRQQVAPASAAAIAAEAAAAAESLDACEVTEEGLQQVQQVTDLSRLISAACDMLQRQGSTTAAASGADPTAAAAAAAAVAVGMPPGAMPSPAAPPCTWVAPPCNGALPAQPGTTPAPSQPPAAAGAVEGGDSRQRLPSPATAAAAGVVVTLSRLQQLMQQLHSQYQAESRALMRCCKFAYAGCKSARLPLPLAVQQRIKSVLQECNEQHAAGEQCWHQLMVLPPPAAEEESLLGFRQQPATGGLPPRPPAAAAAAAGLGAHPRLWMTPAAAAAAAAAANNSHAALAVGGGWGALGGEGDSPPYMGSPSPPLIAQDEAGAGTAAATAAAGHGVGAAAAAAAPPACLWGGLLGGLCMKLGEVVSEEGSSPPSHTPDTTAAQDLLSCYQQCLLVMRRMFDCHEWELTTVKHVFRTLLHALCEQQHLASQQQGLDTISRQDSHAPHGTAAAGVALGVTRGVTRGTRSLLGTPGPVGLMLPPPAPPTHGNAPPTGPSPAAAAAATAHARSAGCALVLQKHPGLLAAVRQVKLQAKLAGVTREGVMLAAQDLLQDLTTALQLAADSTNAAAAAVAAATPTPPPLPPAAQEGGGGDNRVC